MATSFPNSIDTLVNPSSTDSLSNPSHSQQHTNLNDAVESIQTKIGANGSQDPNSIQYKISEIEATLGDIENSTSVAEVLLGLEGNNDLTVEGIENKTTLDYFNKSLYRTVEYTIQISKGSEHYSSKIIILQDGTNVNLVESNIISNTDNSLANITFEENSGIISLCVTPTSTAITARYIRTAIKI
jgi:hypothetical protein